MKAAWLGAMGMTLACLGIAHVARADLNPPPRRDFQSPERFGLEFRGGPYKPDATPDIIGDSGPMLALEFDIWALRIPYLGLLGGSAYIGWTDFSGDARSVDGTSTPLGEETSLVVVPLSSMLVLRVDVLSRQLGIPFVLTGKIGPELAFWWASTGSRSDANNISLGFRWGAQLALELDFLEPRAARSLDEEWGINHTYVFFEFYGSTAGKYKDTANEVGDPFTWAAGLGFIF
ncbi:MAG: hypothetical protein H6714_07805 [Myxococcales bacterium]|nr:hypothetical protein [Myxococcales bacterium]